MARVANVALGITDAIAAGTARTNAKNNVNFMMISAKRSQKNEVDDERGTRKDSYKWEALYIGNVRTT